MTIVPVKFDDPVAIVGGGELDASVLSEAVAATSAVIAADGAADRLAEFNVIPDLLIGDMDSISDLSDWMNRDVGVLELTEQDTSDFEKCLYATDAPLYLCCGFTGRRIDHTLAVFHTMLRNPDKRVLLISADDAIALVPPAQRLELQIETGARVSFFPLIAAVGIASAGLRWPIDGLQMQVGQQVGTSNEAVADKIAVQFDGPGMLVIVERRFSQNLINAVAGA